MSEPEREIHLISSIGHNTDEACERFVHAWNVGPEPRIVDYLVDVSGSERVRRFSELLRRDIHHRDLRSERVSAETYLAQFPADADAIRCVFSELTARQAETCSLNGLGSTVEWKASTSASGRLPRWSAPRFRTIRSHAKGGLGEVFLAEDLEFQREVALKEIQGRKVELAQARDDFSREGRITSRLEHPNIAPVYSLGEFEDGRPFYVMRFIRGESLKEAIDRYYRGTDSASSANRADLNVSADRDLALRQLLGHFVQVCNAVAYAHSRGVIHRDIKPANIMLGDFGETLLVDWGLARNIRDRDDSSNQVEDFVDSSEAATQQGQIKGTPAYMSPEQARGDICKLTDATDIYGLGATLYTLLTGQPPVEGKSSREVLSNVVMGTITPPRARAPQQRIPLALEAICLRATAKDPEQRYSTVKELASDIEHFLADEPVSSFAEPISLRARRWLRKHPAYTASAALLILVSLLGSLSFAVVERSHSAAMFTKNLELDRAKTATELQRDQTEKVLQYFVATFKRTDPKIDGYSVTVASVLKQAEDKLVDDDTIDTLAKARLLEAVAECYDNLGLRVESMQRREQILKLRTLLHGEDHESTLNSLDHLGEACRNAGQYQQALQLAQESLGKRERLFGPSHRQTLECLNRIGLTYVSAGQLTEAIPFLVTTAEKMRKELGPDDVSTLTAISNLGLAYQKSGKLDQAIPLFEETLKRHQALRGPDDSSALIQLNNLATAYADAGQIRRALPLLEDCLARRQRVFGPDHYESLNAMENLANAYRDNGQIVKAVEIHELALSKSKSVNGPAHPRTLLSLNNLAAAHYSSGQVARALPYFEEALQLQRKLLDPGHYETLTTMNNLASAYQALDRFDKALPLYAEALEQSRRTLGPSHQITVGTLRNLAATHWRSGQFDKALPLLEESLEKTREALGPDHPDTLAALGNLAVGYSVAGQPDKALPVYQETLERLRAVFGGRHPDVFFAMSNLAEAHQLAGRLETALPIFREAAEGMEATQLQHEHAGSVLTRLATCLEKLDQVPAAEVWRRKWLVAAKKRNGTDSLEYGSALSQLGKNLILQRDWTEAEGCEREAFAIYLKERPKDWSTFNCQSLWGEAISGQASELQSSNAARAEMKYDEAQTQLLIAYGGIQACREKIPPNRRLETQSQAVERLVKLYNAWQRPDEAAIWQTVLESLSNSSATTPATNRGAP